MKFDADPIARRRVLEAAQRYRGLTFTDRGEILLDVGNVKNGRVILSQRGQMVKLLPETIFSIHQAWRDGDIPRDGKTSWAGSTFSAGDSEVDEVDCVCHTKEQIRISDKRSHTEVSVSREQLKHVVDCIVGPWLANAPSANAEASLTQLSGRSDEGALRQSETNRGKPSPVADLF